MVRCGDNGLFGGVGGGVGDSCLKVLLVMLLLK